MATRAKALTEIKSYGEYAFTCAWTGLTNATTDVGEALEMPGFADRSIQVHGTFGTGGNCKIEGSNDGTNYYVLTDPQGNALDVTAAKIEQVSEITRYIRPRISAGDGTTSLTVTMLLRKGHR